MLGKHHGHHHGGGGWWGGYGPYGGYWPGYEVGPLYVGSVAQSCSWYQDLKTDASGSTVCQAPATWLIVAGAALAGLFLLRQSR